MRKMTGIFTEIIKIKQKAVGNEKKNTAQLVYAGR